MDIDELHKEWAVDTEIDISNLTGEVQRVLKLHAKYYRYYTNEHGMLRKLRSHLTKLSFLKTEYYSGTMAQEDLRKLDWEPFPKRILKSDMSTYIESDAQIIKLKLQIGDQSEKVEFIENIIKSINNRGYLLRTALDYERFRTGS